MTRVNDDVSAVVDAVSLSVRYRVAVVVVVVFFIHSYLLVFLCVCVCLSCAVQRIAIQPLHLNRIYLLLSRIHSFDSVRDICMHREECIPIA